MILWRNGLTGENRMRLINADALLTERKKSKYYHLPNGDIAIPIIDIEHAPTVKLESQWIPFTTRPLTEEEKEEYLGWDRIFDCELPNDGQRILVSVSLRGHECVQYDEFYTDDSCYLDSGYEIGTEAVAWMPLPEPYVQSAENGGK